MSRISFFDKTLRIAVASTLAVTFAVIGSAAAAHGSSDHSGGVEAEAGNAEHAAFDLVHAKISTDGNAAVFHMTVSGKAGETKPASSGKLAGSEVFAYVWPTNIDPSQVGFAPAAGILAMAVTAHPDFDDTPLFDENGDGTLDNDGNVWHSHWVVLGPDDACGADALKVIDIAEGETPRLPKTWPGLPILIDSPGWQPVFDSETVEVRVPFAEVGAVQEANYDGVTSGLRVNANVHAPLLCVENVFDVASGDLSLPGKVE